jgi:PAS domain-containing protein
VAAVALDISELRQAEHALAEREELLRFGFEAARMGVWEWDPAANLMLISPSCKNWRLRSAQQ